MLNQGLKDTKPDKLNAVRCIFFKQKFLSSNPNQLDKVLTLVHKVEAFQKLLKKVTS